MEAERTERKPWKIVIGAIFLCWALAFLGPASWLIYPVLGIALFSTCMRGEWIPALILLTANPLGIAFMGGVVDYTKGAPQLRGVGLPNGEFWNIDRKTRCFRSTSGCLVNGGEWVFQDLHNIALHFLCATFGPPAKSYDGPYPDKETALRIVSAAPLQKPENLSQCRFSIGNEIFQLSPDNAEKLGVGTGIYMPFGQGFDPDMVQVQAAAFERRCLILRFREIDLYQSAKAPENECLVFFDKRNLRPFCYLQISGHRMSRFPRLQYLPEHSR